MEHHPQWIVGATAPSLRIERMGLVVHPSRDVGAALDDVRAWSAEHGAEIVQVARGGQEVADPGDVATCDLVVAIGGDGTSLHALRAAADAARPVLGVAYGSLGALTAVTAEHVRGALERVAAGEWTPRRLPGLRVAGDDGWTGVAINDLIVVRAGASQVLVEIELDGAPYVRYAGDGVVVATPLGSSAYTLGAGGPILAEHSDGLAVTPLAPHGGCCPPLVVGADSGLRILIEPGHAGARMELDGRVVGESPRELRLEREENHATLVGLGDGDPLIAGLRERRIIIDSPRLLARDERAAAPGG